MLTTQDFLVSKENKERIISDYIDTVLSVRLDALNPHVFFIGGQPASGKSHLINVVQSQLPHSFAVDSDELRLRHPQINEIVRQDPLRMDVLSNEPVGEWFRASIDKATQYRENIIIENSFTQSQVLINEAQRLANEGYSVHFMVIAAPEEVSRLGVVKRYKDGVENNGLARWAAQSSHDNAVRKIPTVVAEILRSEVVPQVLVTTRDQRIRTVLNRPEETEKVFADLRQQVLTPNVVAAWKKTYAQCAGFFLARGLVTSYTQPTLSQLHSDAEKLLFPHELPAEHRELGQKLAAL
ncbi:MAG: zeta toxin family protein [Corynebacterium sp.]|uniref:zeta toxin family protein n=1 Tax=Corynebacterium sp. TaxID=1720 RepID=UPI0026DC799A|nr:zeta toxin family protein [Corynebacterium sp.]MDO4760654.1 zeta toxin family protein [Corynebacterium sp.]